MRVVISFLALTAVACQDYGFVFRPNQRIAVTTVREVVIANTDTDILFVVDNSGSMKEEQQNLVRNTRAFIEELAVSENAYRVGVITTDAFAANDAGRLRLVPASAGDLSAAGCGSATPNPGTQKWLERPSLTSPNLADEQCRLVEDFINTIDNLEPVDGNGDGCFVFGQDTIGDGREAGLLTAALAATDPDALAVNGSFLREEADLALIFLTDESDCSFGSYPPESSSTNSWCYDQINNAVPVEEYVDLFAGLKPKGGERKVRAALIGGGVFKGADVLEFVPRGCRLDAGANAATDDCGCWSSTISDFPCRFLNDLGHPCTASTTCSATGSCDNEYLTCAGPGGGCNTQRCEAMPAFRYHEFIMALGDARVDVGFPRGTFEDSICKPEYDDTLRQIARTVVLSTCFPLEEEVLDSNRVKMLLRITGVECSTDSDCDVSVACIAEQCAANIDVPGVTGRPCTTVADCPVATKCGAEDQCVMESQVPECSGTECTTCAGALQNGAWELTTPTEICLKCGLKKEPGTDFVLTILNELVGFDGGPP